MENKIDIHFSNKKLIRKIELIKSSTELSKQNKKYLLDFEDFCKADGLVDCRTLHYLHILVRIAKVLKKDFKKVKKKDLVQFLSKIEGNTDYSEHSKQSYKVTIKKFYRWLFSNGDPYYQPPLIRWIKTGIKSSRKRLPEELLSEEEVEKLIENCDNFRDKAFISTLYESGCRPAELLTIKIKDITFDENGVKCKIFDKEGKLRVIVDDSNGEKHLEFVSRKHAENNSTKMKELVNDVISGRYRKMKKAYEKLRRKKYGVHK